MFIDFLHLKKRKFLKQRLIVFYGVSGGGKSTYLHFFEKKFLDSIFLFHKNKPICYTPTKRKNIFIDEVVYFSQFVVILRYLINGKRVFVATHIPLFYYRIIFSIFRLNCFSTENNIEKIKLYLQGKNILSDTKSLEYFVKKYKGSFTDIDMMIKFYPEKREFSEIQKLFEHECRIERRMNY